jgi:hypothetical protein
MESQEMERRLDRVETKIDGMVDRIGSIDNTLIKQSVILDEHIKTYRTIRRTCFAY